MGRREGEGTNDMGSATPERACCPVVEFRQYALHPGQRDGLIDLFDRAFVESQEAVGIEVIGQFRDLDEPDRFVWLRGFPDMATRVEGLAAFYDGPVWAEHRDEANATMISWDDVLLLRPAFPGCGFASVGERPSPGTEEPKPPGLVTATVYPLAAPSDDGFAGFFEGALAPALAESGAAVLAAFATEPSPNAYPRLPVREGEQVFVWFARFADRAAYAAHVAALAGTERWQNGLAAELADLLEAPPEVRLLAPTPRSRLR